MKISVFFGDLEGAGKKFMEISAELEQIRKEMESQMTALAQVWQGADSQALQETFYAAGGLNEFSKRMIRGYLAFGDHFYDAKRTYMSVSQSLADAEAEASRKTTLF